MAEAGLIMYYVEGNRDFGIAHYRGELFRDVSDTSFSMKWGERRIFAEHGDLINLEDRPYRFWRKITKNRASFFLLEHLPSFVLLRLGIYLEKRMKSTNVKYKSYYPEAHCKQFYEAQFADGNDLVVVGHFHEEREVHTKRGEKSMLFYNLPGWENGFRYLSIPQNNSSPFFVEIK